MGLSFIATTTTNWGVYDEDIGFTVVNQSPVGYYGCTWDREKAYVAEKVSSNEQYPAAQHSITVLKTLDRDLAELDSTVLDGVIDCHQILSTGERMLVCNTAEGALSIFKPCSGTIRKKSWKGLNHLSHFNSIYRHVDGDYYVCFHRKGKSQVIKLDEDFMVKKVWKVGKHAHNVYREDDSIYLCDSFHNQFVEMSMETGRVTRRVEVPRDFLGGNGWFTRGLARGDDFFLVGLSMVKPRGERRDNQFSAVIRINNDFKIDHHYVLPSSGGVTDVRLTSEMDWAHNRIEF